MKQKKVRLFVDGEVLAVTHFSGIGHYTADLLRAIDKLLFEEEFAHIKVEIGVPPRLKHRVGRFGFENFSLRLMPFPIRVTNELKRTGKLLPIDLLYGRRVYFFPNYSSWPTLFSPSIPVIYDLSFVYHAAFVEPRNQAFLIDQAKLSAKRSAKVLTISINSKNEIMKEYNCLGDNIPIAYPAVDLHKFYRRSAHEIAVTKAMYGIFGEYILFVGNIEPRKNLISLLRAYRELPPKLQKEYGLLLVGAKGWLDNEIKDMILSMRMDGLKVLQPTDYVVDEDLPALYSGASAFAYVSRYEGFGIPPIEAMACGTPVVCSNNSSLPEATGDAALSVEATDSAAIAKALEEVLTNEKTRKSLVKKGYKQIENFSWEASARELLKAAEEVY